MVFGVDMWRPFTHLLCTVRRLGIKRVMKYLSVLYQFLLLLREFVPMNNSQRGGEIDGGRVVLDKKVRQQPFEE